MFAGLHRSNYKFPPPIEVTTPSGRTLAVTDEGHPDDPAVILMHGMPGSRLGIYPRPTVLARNEIRLITYDRPGYGGSTRQPGRQIVDCVEDVLSIVNDKRFNLARVGIVGRSGGGPYALACAAKLPGMVRHAVALGTTAPAAFLSPDQTYEGMAGTNRVVYESDAAAVEADITERTAALQKDPEWLLRLLEPDLRLVDQADRALGGLAARALILASFREAVRPGPGGWIDDVLAQQHRHPGFELAEITVPVSFWHGTADPFASHTDAEALAAQLTNARVDFELAPEKSHFNMLEVLTKYLARAAHADS